MIRRRQDGRGGADGGDSGSSGDDDGSAFAEAIRGVTPLAAGPRRILRTDRPPGPATAAAPARASGRSGGARAPSSPAGGGGTAPDGGVVVDEQGEIWSGRADGVDRRVLRKLRDGSPPVEATLDLHGLTRAAADAALHRLLGDARASGLRCLLVIHGRGLHSGRDSGVTAERVPALREVVRAALVSGPHAAAVLALSSAPATLGGTGATLILLRR